MSVWIGRRICLRFLRESRIEPISPTRFRHLPPLAVSPDRLGLDDLPADVLGIILGKLEGVDKLRFAQVSPAVTGGPASLSIPFHTPDNPPLRQSLPFRSQQASPAARRLCQGDTPVPDVLGPLVILITSEKPTEKPYLFFKSSWKTHHGKQRCLSSMCRCGSRLSQFFLNFAPPSPPAGSALVVQVPSEGDPGVFCDINNWLRRRARAFSHVYVHDDRESFLEGVDRQDHKGLTNFFDCAQTLLSSLYAGGFQQHMTVKFAEEVRCCTRSSLFMISWAQFSRPEFRHLIISYAALSRGFVYKLLKLCPVETLILEDCTPVPVNEAGGDEADVWPADVPPPPRLGAIDFRSSLDEGPNASLDAVPILTPSSRAFAWHFTRMGYWKILETSLAPCVSSLESLSLVIDGDGIFTSVPLSFISTLSNLKFLRLAIGDCWLRWLKPYERIVFPSLERLEIYLEDDSLPPYVPPRQFGHDMEFPIISHLRCPSLSVLVCSIKTSARFMHKSSLLFTPVSFVLSFPKIRVFSCHCHGVADHFVPGQISISRLYLVPPLLEFIEMSGYIRCSVPSSINLRMDEVPIQDRFLRTRQLSVRCPMSPSERLHIDYALRSDEMFARLQISKFDLHSVSAFPFYGSYLQTPCFV